MTSELLDRPATNVDTFVLTPDETLVERYRRLAASTLGAIQAEAVRNARYELDLPPDERRRRICTRLRSWLALTPEEARLIVAAVKDAYRELALEERLELIDAEHDAAAHGLLFAEAQRIAQLVPWLGDCAVKQPQEPHRAGSPTLSFVAAAMGLDLV